MRVPSGKIINCKACHNPFYIPKNRFKTALYCSRQCSAKGNTTRYSTNCEMCGKCFFIITTRANKAKYCSRKCYHKSQISKGTKKFKCNHCSKEFLDSPSKKRKYCSKACVNKSTKESFEPKFTTVRKMMKRRGLIKSCDRCGFDSVKEILGIHHKDRNPKNNSIENLEVLCPNCHSIEHKKHIAH